MDKYFSQPVTGVVGRTILLLDCISPDYNHTQVFTGSRTRALNISSYNYLGFAQGQRGCADAVEEAIKRYDISVCGARLEGGSSDIHTVTEALVANFVGMEDALISLWGLPQIRRISLPWLAKRYGEFGSSLERSHQSRTTQDTSTMEKILLIVEGLYSMEGTLVNLPRIMELKQKYKVRNPFLTRFLFIPSLVLCFRR